VIAKMRLPEVTDIRAGSLSVAEPSLASIPESAQRMEPPGNGTAIPKVMPAMKTGIIGLPQVGKTSLFKILTKAKLEEIAESARGAHRRGARSRRAAGQAVGALLAEEDHLRRLNLSTWRPSGRRR
jgi:GTPase SAR1 family protein